MRSSRASTAWAGIALSTSLIGLAVAGAQTQPSVPTNELPNTSVYVLSSDSALDSLKPGATRYVRGVEVSDGGNLTGSSDQNTAVAPR